MASFSINGGHLGSCALIDPNRDLTEEFWSGGGTHISGRVDAVSKRPNMS